MKEKSVIELKTGEKATVVSIQGQNAASIRKLTAFGLLPGTEVEMIQTFPAFVLKVDNTQLALDYKAAVGITVVMI